MVVKVVIVDSDSEKILDFDGEDELSFAEMARKYGLKIPISCGIGNCGICKLFIISGYEYIEFEKKSKIIGELSQTSDGYFRNIFSCIAGIKKLYLQSEDLFEIILQKSF